MGKETSASSQRRSDYGRIQMTPRDRTLLAWIGEQYAVRSDQLQRLAAQHGDPTLLNDAKRLSDPGVRRLYSRWQKAGWIEKQKLLVGDPLWLWSTLKGLRDSGSPYPFHRPAVSRLNHIYHVNAVRLEMEARWGHRGRWTSERELHRRMGDSPYRHMVDAEFVRHEGERIGIEVELTQKSKSRLKAILSELARNYHSVWYFALTPTYAAVEKALRAMPDAEKTFRLYPLEPLLTSLKAGN